MIFLLISFVAGVLTVLAPCVLPLLPVIVGGSLTDARSKWKPYVITASLALSVIAFTLLLKVATIFIDIPQTFWQYFSGVILIVFGFSMIFPNTWEKVSIKWNLLVGRKSNTLLAEGVKKESFWGDIIIGAALGPVFSSCSPVYFVILATVLPASFFMGFLDLIVYALGLSLALLLIAILGQRIVGKLEGASDPRGWFKRSLGALFLIVGIFVFTGLMNRIERALIQSGFVDITKIETSLLKTSQKDAGINLYPKYVEIVNPSGFVNSGPFKLADLVGKKAILLDFMTYSCINCQRTYPYLAAWYKKYKDYGLEIVAIHTPEFAFERKKENVEAAFKQFGLTFPAILDNDYGTWNAYGNNFWPHKYLIDIDGYIVYDHIGEGAYEETEAKIKELLTERAKRLGTSVDTSGSASLGVAPAQIDAVSRETYFGAFRNSEFFGNGESGKIYTGDFSLPSSFASNRFYLKGRWKIEKEYIESDEEAEIAFSYNAMKVHLVAEAPAGAVIQIQNSDARNISNVSIKDATLYTIISNPERRSGTMYLKVPKGVRLYALTFG